MSTEISMEARVVVPDTVLARDLGDEIVLLNTEREEFLGLDDVGARMWHALRESESIEAAYQRVYQEYVVEPEVLRKDLLDLLRQLLDAGLVCIDPMHE